MSSNRRHSPEYQAALKSDHWRELRELVRVETLNRCEACGKPWAPGRRLELHHLTYERLGCELRSDVMFLCPDCHCIADDQRKEHEDFREHRPGYYRQAWADDPSDHQARRAAETWWSDRWQQTLKLAAALTRRSTS